MVAISEATGHPVDFDIYRMGAAHLFGQHLYDTRLSRALMGGHRGMRFTYPPFAAFAFWPFTLMPVTAAQLTWAVINVLALGALAGVSIRAVRPDWPAPRVWITAAIVLFPVLWLNPDALTLSYGQINFFIVLLVMVDLTSTLRWRGHALPRGVLLGVAAAVKLTPLIFVPYLFLTRQTRAGIAAVTAFMACSLTAFAVAPHSSWVYWSAEMFHSHHFGNLLYISNQDLRGALQRITAGGAPHMMSALAVVVFGAVGLAVAAWACRRSSPMAGILVTAASGLLVSPVSWVHHYVWITPALAWLILGHDRPVGGRWWALGAASLFWAAPVWWVPDPQTGYGGPLILLAGNSFCLAAVAFLLLVGVMLLSRTPIRLAAGRTQRTGQGG